jgi:hypothetical protein
LTVVAARRWTPDSARGSLSSSRDDLLGSRRRTRDEVTDNFDRADPPGSGGAGSSRLAGVIRLGEAIGATALRPAVGGLSLGLAAEREVRHALSRRASETALATLDAVLASRFAEEAVDRVVTSALTERAVSRALEGSLVEAAGRDVVRFAVLERVADSILSGDAVEAVLERAQAADVPRRVADRLLAEGMVEEAAARVLEGPEVERVVEAALESAAMERLVGRIVESRLVDEAVARLLESEDLWLLVDEIAHSPSVTDAITQQSMSFADEVADRVRARSRGADAWLERKARRALRRKSTAELPPDGFTGRPTT